jgi:uncharacterized protein
MLQKLKRFFRRDSVEQASISMGDIKRKLNEVNADVKTSSSQFKSDGWMNILTGLGQPGRDKTVSTTFRACPSFCWRELDDLYRADGLTRRIIDIVACEMIRQGWEVEGDPECALMGKLEDLNAFSKLTQLIQWSRLYGGAIIVLGINDNRRLDEPVNINSIRDVSWMHIFDRWQTNVLFEHLTVDLNSPNYGYPEIYTINDYRTGATFNVHYSRILRMDWSILPPRERNFNQGWGDSVVLSIYDELKNYGSAFANTSAIMQDFVNGVLKIPGLSQSMASSCNDAAILKRLDFANLSKGVTNMMVLDGEEDFEKLSTNVGGISELLDRFMLALSSVTGIPVTLLFGRSPAGLNATGDADVRNFYDMVKQYQEFKLKPLLETLTYYLFKSKDGPTEGNEPENWSIQFSPLWQNTDEQEANLRRTVAETDAIYIDRGVLDPDEVAMSRFGGDRWSMSTSIDIESRENKYDLTEVPLAKEEIESPDEPIVPVVESEMNGGGASK